MEYPAVMSLDKVGESTKDTVKTIRAGKGGMSRRHLWSTRGRLTRTRDCGWPAGARSSLGLAFERRATSQQDSGASHREPASAIGVSVEGGGPLPMHCHCERSEAIQTVSAEGFWIASLRSQ